MIRTREETYRAIDRLEIYTEHILVDRTITHERLHHSWNEIVGSIDSAFGEGLGTKANDS